jgi:YHS domain-containing protein
MKTKFILTSLAIALIAIVTNVSYSQESCCKEGASCCTENSACCTDNAANTSQSTGNAGGDSTTAATVCLISGESIGEGQGVKFDYYGKTYNFCCEGCLAKFKKDPLDHIKGAVECPVMGDAIETKDVFVMHNDTKYYLCCESCVKAFKKDPEKYIGQK